jgi:hypothetical protein
VTWADLIDLEGCWNGRGFPTLLLDIGAASTRRARRHLGCPTSRPHVKRQLILLALSCWGRHYAALMADLTSVYKPSTPFERPNPCCSQPGRDMLVGRRLWLESHDIAPISWTRPRPLGAVAKEEPCRSHRRRVLTARCPWTPVS